MNVCIYSSLIFIVNAVVNYLCGYFVYSICFAFLCTTSVLYHSNKTYWTNLVDKLAIVSVVLYGGYLFFTKVKDVVISSFIVATFLSTILLYYYGYEYKQFCFSFDKYEADMFHAFIHMVVSVGHLMIVLL